MNFSLLLQAAGNPFASKEFAIQLALIALVFYFLMFRPMQKQKQKQAAMLAALKNGDTVITASGITGVIAGLDSDTIIIKVKPDNVKLQFVRSAVTAIQAPEGSK